MALAVAAEAWLPVAGLWVLRGCRVRTRAAWVSGAEPRAAAGCEEAAALAEYGAALAGYGAALAGEAYGAALAGRLFWPAETSL